jgi:hypothetical protein
MNDGRGKRGHRAAFVIVAAGLLAMGSVCRETMPGPHEITLRLVKESETTPTGQTRVRCKYKELLRDELSQKDGEMFHFTIANECEAPQWIGVTYLGNLPLESCSGDFPLLRWREFPVGRRGAGVCVLPLTDTHCHRLDILVRSSKNELTPFAVPSPIASRDDCPKPDIRDHSLEFHDIPP